MRQARSFNYSRGGSSGGRYNRQQSNNNGFNKGYSNYGGYSKGGYQGGGGYQRGNSGGGYQRGNSGGGYQPGYYRKPNSFYHQQQPPYQKPGLYSRAHYSETQLQEHGLKKSDVLYQKFLTDPSSLNPFDWQQQNTLYCQRQKKIVTQLTQNALERLMLNGHLGQQVDNEEQSAPANNGIPDSSLNYFSQTSQVQNAYNNLVQYAGGQNLGSETHLQIILVKFCDQPQADGSTKGSTTSSNAQVKARLMVSDGRRAAIAILHAAIYDKLELGENQELRQFDVIRVRKCVVKQVGKDANNQQSVIVFTEPIEIVYTNMQNKIGAPSQDFDEPVQQGIDISIPSEDIMHNMDVEEHEIIYARGGHIPLAKLHPTIKGKWRIRVRLTKKYDVKTWQNAKGEGQLQNMEFQDKDGTRMQATLFKELVDLYSQQLIQGNVFEISLGVIKANNQQFVNQNGSKLQDQQKSEYNFIFDQKTQLNPCVDDQEIPYLQKEKPKDCEEFRKVKFMNLLTIADIPSGRNTDFVGVILKIGQVEQVPLKSGQVKLRRKVLVCDDSALSIVICFWSDKHNDKLVGCEAGSVIAVIKLRVSDYYHKSLNSNEDSQVFINPQGLSRATQLIEWYKHSPEQGQQFTIHPLSGSLDVDSKPEASAEQSAQQDQEKETGNTGVDTVQYNGFGPVENPEETGGLFKDQQKENKDEGKTEDELKGLFVERRSAENSQQNQKQSPENNENNEQNQSQAEINAQFDSQESYDEGGKDFHPNRFGTKVEPKPDPQPEPVDLFSKSEPKADERKSSSDQQTANPDASKAEDSVQQAPLLLNPHDIRIKLLKAQRKQFNRQFYTKSYIQDQQDFEKHRDSFNPTAVLRKGRCGNSGIGEERIRHMQEQEKTHENAQEILERAARGRRGRPRKNQYNNAAQNQNENSAVAEQQDQNE